MRAMLKRGNYGEGKGRCGDVIWELAVLWISKAASCREAEKHRVRRDYVSEPRRDGFSDVLPLSEILSSA
jgi:hypothetical protein